MTQAAQVALRQCSGKRTYTHADAKKTVVRIMSGRSHRNDRTKLDAYRCPHCGWYHVGHPKRKP